MNLLHALEEVMHMVTYSDLFQFGILIVQIVALVIQVNNKKK